MNASQDFRTLFFEEFVKRLLIKALPKEPRFEKGENLLGKLDKVSYIPPKLEIKPLQETPPHLEPELLKKKTMEELKKAGQEIIEIKPQEAARETIIKPLQMIQAQPIAQQPMMQRAMPQQIPERPKISVMEKLNPILADPSVQSINCPGPNQNITILRMGIPQITQMSFTSNEINDFMKDMSEKTKIPLLPGLFKVVFQNIIVTAVISEFIGTKFLIEKRLTQALPPMPIKAQFR